VRELKEILHSLRHAEQGRILIFNFLALQIIKCVAQVKQLIEVNEKVKEYLVNEVGLTCFLHLVEVYLPKYC
jgi:hypothetical protein